LPNFVVADGCAHTSTGVAVTSDAFATHRVVDPSRTRTHTPSDVCAEATNVVPRANVSTPDEQSEEGAIRPYAREEDTS
jgi:hypothetical protein